MAGGGLPAPGAGVLTGAKKIPVGNGWRGGAHRSACELEAKKVVLELIRQFSAFLVVKTLVSLFGESVVENMTAEKILVQAKLTIEVIQEVPLNPTPVEFDRLKSSKDFNVGGIDLKIAAKSVHLSVPPPKAGFSKSRVKRVIFY
ncbi:hypothetical protein KI387_005319, partial [Taxus chinensis]